MRQIGIRELRQRASQYLALVAQGERVEVTDRGRAVAMLVPVRGNRWEDLVASGRITLPTDDLGIEEEEPGDYEVDASGTLAITRDLER